MAVALSQPGCQDLWGELWCVWARHFACSCLINVTRLSAWVGTGLLPRGRNTEDCFAEPRCLPDILQSGTGWNLAGGVRRIKEITLGGKEEGLNKERR